MIDFLNYARHFLNSKEKENIAPNLSDEIEIYKVNFNWGILKLINKLKVI